MKKFFTLLFALTSICISRTLAQTTILSADFESGTSLPAGWTQTTNATDGGWLIGTNTQLQSSSFPITAHTQMICTNDDGCNCDKSDDLLMTSAMDLTSYTDVFLSFDNYYYNLSYQSAVEEATIEVSTNGGTNWTVINTLSGNLGDWETRYVDLTAYAGMNNVMVGFRYNDNGGWLYGWAMDNVSVFAPVPGLDITVTSVLAGKNDPTPAFVGYPNYLINLPLQLKIKVDNLGTVPINSFDVSWTDGTNTYNQSFTGLNISALGSYSFTATQAYNVLSGAHNLQATVSNVNGGASELSTSNNSAGYSVTGITPNPDKKYFSEEATGTWCGWCPRGAVFMEYMKETYPDMFVGVAVHNGDPMVVTEYDAAIGSMIAGYPSVVIDRTDVLDPSQLEGDFLSKISNAPAVKLTGDATYNATSNVMTVNISGLFTQNLSGDYRFAAIVAEDSVHGSGSTWGQHNYYTGNAAGPMNGWESLPGTVPASQMYYNFVGRDLMGGYDGVSGSLPSSISSGNTYTYTLSGAGDASWDPNRLYVVILVEKASNNQVLNVNKLPVTVTVGTDDLPVNTSAFIYPNPSSSNSVIDLHLKSSEVVSAKIYNSLGQLCSDINYGNLVGDQLLPIDGQSFSSGIYNVVITAGDEVVAKKLVISK